MSASDPSVPAEWLEAARAAAGDARSALSVAEAVGRPLARADASTVMGALAALGEVDLTVARVVEPHVDALTIHAEAGTVAAPGSWGVFAAESPGAQLRAEHSDGQWLLSGTKPWCSLAGLLDHALVTASSPDGRGLFSVDLTEPGVRVEPTAWVARGLTTVVTTDVGFDAVPAAPIGPAGWYLTRPGFAWGGIRVAACWAGAAKALAASLASALAARAQPDPIRLAQLGRADVAVWSATLALDHAAREIDEGRAVGPDAAVLAGRTRAVVAEAAETVMREVGHALGPAPLAFDDAHARRVADLTLYIRQHHADRDHAALGELTLQPDSAGA